MGEMMIAVMFFALGMIVGSFLSIITFRLPGNGSVVYSASHCPHCQHSLDWQELIPLLSYLWQQGKCRHCGTAVFPQYPLLELTGGFTYTGLFIFYGLRMELLIALIFVSILIPIVLIDFRHQIIPDALNIAGAIAGLAAIHLTSFSFMDAMLGVFAGGGIMLLIAVVSRGGMGGGDIKMTAWMGLFLGWKMTLLALFISFIISGFASFLLIIFKIKKRKDFIPFGPFLAAGGFTAYVFGREILARYLQNL
jgi:leader peptidase (prepilin peptidase)/N-methyltransferase